MQDEYNDIEKHYLLKIHNAQYICREQFKKVIATNNKETILRVANYITSKSNNYFHPCQFLFQHIYKIEHNMLGDYQVTDELIDLKIFDQSISLSNSLHIEMQRELSFLMS